MTAKVAAEKLISLYLPNLEGGGAERMMLTLARGLRSRGVRVDLVLAKAYGPYLAEAQAHVNVVDLDSNSALASVPRLRRYLADKRPAAALGTLPHASLALLWAARTSGKRIRVVIREASTPSMVKPNGLDVKTRFARRLSRVFYPHADAVVAVSHGVARDLREYLGVPGSKITTIYNPVVADSLPEAASEAIDHPWFRPGSPPVLLSVGRLGAEKDFQSLLRAFALVRGRVDARLVILGEGAERQRLERLSEELGIEESTCLPGFIANPFPYMARASVYVLSSEREGLPGSLIQAMACGCPVVSTDCPNGPREVLEDGRYGKLVPVGDHHAIAEAVLETLRCPPPAEQAKLRSRSFSEQSSFDSYLELLLPGD
ncbi:MAG: glycosyltransferase [Trueperaceae bacterium]